VVYKLN